MPISSLIDIPIASLHAKRPETISLERAALISGSLNLAPAGMSSNFAFGRSGGAGGRAMPFTFNLNYSQ